ncbi:MAG TPA: PilZ domain-containing protein [Bryobacteraceae bacterium]
MGRSSEWEIEEPGGIAGDRRSDRRYRLRLDLRWRLIHRRKVQDAGSGHSVDISSGGILFEVAQEMPVGRNVELSISWPVLLRQVAPMQLVVSGRIVRSEGRLVAVRVSQHEFRTMAATQDLRVMPAPSLRNPDHFSQGGMSTFRRTR